MVASISAIWRKVTWAVTRTIMTDGTVNTLSGAVTQTDYIDI